MVDSHGSTEITVRDLWEQMIKMGSDVTDIKQNVSNLETKLDSVIIRGEDHEKRMRELENTTTNIKSLNLADRITSIERKVWALPSVLSVIAFAALIVSIITLVTKHG